MQTDITAQLIDGGLAPTAAKIIGNAISNLYTARTHLGRQLTDATPDPAIRLINSDTRRYVLTNLDYPSENPFRQRVESTASRFAPKRTVHPYDKSQPATADPTLSVPNVKSGKYLSVSSATKDEVAQSEVTLRIAERGGSHARLNAATGEIESVPILIEVEPKNRLEASVEERSDATVIRLRLLN